MSRYSYNSTTGELTLIAGNSYYNYIAPKETSPATAAHAEGTHIIFDGNLCEVISDIAVNDVLAVGTNLSVADTLTEQIDTINNVLTNKADKSQLSNPNLLDNPWFTVNQRGQSNYPSTTWTYWVDRWQTLSKSSSTVGRTILLDNGIKISADTTSTTCDIVYERKMKDDFVFGKTYTLSFMLGDGTIYSKSGVITEPDGTYKINITLTGRDLNARIANETNQQVSCIITAIKDNTAMTLRAVKLELGSVSTLVNDVAPDYVTELAKCRASKADSTDAYANQGQINVGTPNPNLLNNPFFTVNQRGQNSYTTNTTYIYTYDRWKIYNATFENVSDGVKFTAKATTLCVLGQWIENFENLDGKTVTISAIINGVLQKATGTFVKNNTNIGISAYTTGSEYYRFQLVMDANDANPRLVLCTYTTTPLIITAVKLELGSVSTLAQDTAPNYSEELLKCQRYFYRLSPSYSHSANAYCAYALGESISATKAVISLHIPVKMRTIPTISQSGAIAFVEAANASYKAVTITLSSIAENVLMLYATGTGLTAGNVGLLSNNNDTTAYIDISADL